VVEEEVETLANNYQIPVTTTLKKKKQKKVTKLKIERKKNK
jgi:hypothetical protein